jgi:hypothetical protein
MSSSSKAALVFDNIVILARVMLILLVLSYCICTREDMIVLYCYLRVRVLELQLLWSYWLASYSVIYSVAYSVVYSVV